MRVEREKLRLKKRPRLTTSRSHGLSKKLSARRKKDRLDVIEKKKSGELRWPGKTLKLLKTRNVIKNCRKSASKRLKKRDNVGKKLKPNARPRLKKSKGSGRNNRKREDRK